MSTDKSNKAAASSEKVANASEPAHMVDAPVYSNAFHRFCEEWLVVPKMLYFGLNVVIYSTHAFLMQYVTKRWGIAKNEYSLTNFVQFTNIFGSIVFSRLADRTGAYRAIISGCVAAYCISMCMLMFPFFSYTENYFLCLGHYLVINALAFFFTAGTFPLLDSMVMSKLSANPKFSKEMFGRQRLWGTIGHCVIGVFVHWFAELELIKNSMTDSYTVMFYILIATSVMFIALVFVGIPKDLKIEAHSHGHHGHGGAAKDEKSPAGPKPSASALLLNPGFAFFLLTVLVAGIVRSVITTYQSGYITDELHLKKSVVSGSIFIRVFPEAALYFFSKEITQWFGIYWVLLIGHVAGVVRMFGYTLVPAAAEEKIVAIKNGKEVVSFKEFDPSFPVLVVIYALECLKGINSSLVISSAARIASDMAPKGLASTAQGYVSGVWQGLSMTLASALCLVTVHYFKIIGTFRGVSIVGAACVTLIALKFALIDRTIFVRNTKSVA